MLFQRLVIRIREAIIETLNQTLECVGSVIKPLGRLRVEGLPTSNDVDDSLGHLDAGDRQFKELLDPFLGH
ncbi:hypothetical protein C1280_19850 [Gemmata obscuriglobus]|uniref:Uncharacterized protein n=1 Tax=Gemmata obscuriglobus TaxID=114 RepID=A0A2Z3HBJ5_9BACT|nr:hypothetical protein C1280_19850 [Gemmata obscuriglobus]